MAPVAITITIAVAHKLFPKFRHSLIQNQSPTGFFLSLLKRFMFAIPGPHTILPAEPEIPSISGQKCFPTGNVSVSRHTPTEKGTRTQPAS